jgi:hypothetical protein
MPDSFYGVSQISPLILPGNLVDSLPSNPTPWDDEFDGNTLNPKWTIWNQQAGQTITVANSHITFVTPANYQARIFSIIQPAPSGNWKFRAKMAFDCSTWNFLSVGLIGRRITGSDRSKYGGSMFHSTYGAQCFYSMNIAGTSYNSDDHGGYRHESAIFYLEMEYEGTNIIWRMSQSGSYYFQAYSYPISSWINGAPEWVGINCHPYCETNNANWGGTVSVDWFRKVI